MHVAWKGIQDKKITDLSAALCFSLQMFSAIISFDSVDATVPVARRYIVSLIAKNMCPEVH